MSKNVVAAGDIGGIGSGVFIDGRVGTLTRTCSSQVVEDIEGPHKLPILVLCVASCSIATGTSGPEETRYGSLSTDNLRRIILARDGYSRRKGDYGCHDE